MKSEDYELPKEQQFTDYQYYDNKLNLSALYQQLPKRENVGQQSSDLRKRLCNMLVEKINEAMLIGDTAALQQKKERLGQLISDNIKRDADFLQELTQQALLLPEQQRQQWFEFFFSFAFFANREQSVAPEWLPVLWRSGNAWLLLAYVLQYLGHTKELLNSGIISHLVSLVHLNCWLPSEQQQQDNNYLYIVDLLLAVLPYDAERITWINKLPGYFFGLLKRQNTLLRP